MASQSLFLTEFIRGRRFLSFFVAAAMNRTPSTRCSFHRKSGVSCSDSAGFVFVPSSVVATSPSVMRWWLASSYVVLCVLVEGSTLGAFSSWMHF